MKPLIFLTAMISIVALQSSWGSTPEAPNSDEIAAFTALLQKFDLNKETQNGFAITETEYEQLSAAWQALSRLEKNQLLIGAAGSWWKNTCAMALLYDLNNKAQWENHIENLTNLGRRGLSLTVSLLNNPVNLVTARSMLVDLLCIGPSMVFDGRLEIVNEIKIQAVERAGGQARQRLEKWEQLINDYQNHTTADKLKAINDFFNQQIKPENDRGSIKAYDYWQSPIETLARGIGDCDDFAMAKYVSLRLLGVPPKQLRVAALKDRQIGGHSVLFFYPQNDENPLVLDCRAFVHLGHKDHHILPLTRWKNLHKMKPLYEINEDLLRLFDQNFQPKRTYLDPRNRLPKFGIALINSRRVLPF